MLETPATPRAALPVLADAALDDTFRCAQWACRLSFRACLERQTATKLVRSLAEQRPRHTFCARECQVGAGIAERFRGELVHACTRPEQRA